MEEGGAGTRQRILSAAAEIVRMGGPGALTFDAVAARLGITKQAVIYWFPTKAELMSGVSVPFLEAEAEAVVAAVSDAESPADAARRVVAAVTDFHLGDLDRFRLMYVVPQSGRRPGARETAAVLERVHPVTTRMYDAVEAALGGGGEARETAVALHMAALGVAMLTATTEALGDPMAQAPRRLAARLAAIAERGAMR
ncbi:hypothetical protein DRV85_02460 [Rhodosalinus halophilus]|uniref:HTH tetR-type domain-containing protein n=1 Tax=Rhodosalinus halophilus TaxID=2259333 RepID=A0A365UC58_9RHOB|nr:TetR/AcrR family transcriptional regulator [Rhodosalinus halophilus]RBI87007.1 hypothetical protein DRV85_02460 [Rhodosalinus halophilus]